MPSMNSSRLRVAVLRGGPSKEYDVSLKTGGHVLTLLRNKPDDYEPVDIFISKNGDWHHEGLVHQPHKALRHVDVVWNGLHGHFGEDGQVQKILDDLQIPYTGSNAMASALAMNKDMAKRVYEQHGILTPRHEVVSRDDYGEEKLHFIFRNYMHPVIVKPANGGSSIGMRVAHTFRELEDAVMHALEHSYKAVVEEFIRGKEATCGVVEHHRGEKLYALIPVEINRPKHKHFFDFEDKYSGETQELCPGTFTIHQTDRIEDMARQAHQALGLRHYSRSDFIVTKKNKIYILETNSLPGFTQESLLPKSIHATGWHPQSFVDHVIGLALNKKMY